MRRMVLHGRGHIDSKHIDSKGVIHGRLARVGTTVRDSLRHFLEPKHLLIQAGWRALDARTACRTSN